jgi:uncharacterized metal-binding protein
MFEEIKELIDAFVENLLILTAPFWGTWIAFQISPIFGAIVLFLFFTYWVSQMAEAVSDGIKSAIRSAVRQEMEPLKEEED